MTMRGTEEEPSSRVISVTLIVGRKALPATAFWNFQFNIFQLYHDHGSRWLFPHEEGFHWLRGRHAADSDEVKAVRVAQELSR
jgi:hypothetical protein